MLGIFLFISKLCIRSIYDIILKRGEIKMKVALASIEFINNDILFNLSQIEKYLKEASSKDCDAICFGEAFLQGFDCLNFTYEHDIKIAISQESETMEFLKGLTIKYNIDLMLGYIEKENKDIYSSYCVFSSGKIIYNYRRISKGWKEYWRTSVNYKEGLETKGFIYKDKHFKIALCGDLWEEETECFKECDVLLWPVYCNYTKEEWETGTLMEYVKQAHLVNSRVLFINSHTKYPLSLGGAYDFCNGKIKSKLDMGIEGILYINI